MKNRQSDIKAQLSMIYSGEDFENSDNHHFVFTFILMKFCRIAHMKPFHDKELRGASILIGCVPVTMNNVLGSKLVSNTTINLHLVSMFGGSFITDKYKKNEI